MHLIDGRIMASTVNHLANNPSFQELDAVVLRHDTAFRQPMILVNSESSHG
jgi:hypothetical protein